MVAYSYSIHICLCSPRAHNLRIMLGQAEEIKKGKKNIIVFFTCYHFLLPTERPKAHLLEEFHAMYKELGSGAHISI